MSLHDELDRIADSQPAFRPDPALWDRGRRARRRSRVVAGAAALAVVAVVGGVGATSLRPDDLSPADADGAATSAIPSLIHAGVPGDFMLGDVPGEGPADAESGAVSWDEDVVETDLAIGRASVAFAAPGEYAGALPVVVTATDGDYHFLDLPGWVGASHLNDGSGPLGLSLSPDGHQLAYAWWDPSAAAADPMPSGLRVVDLGTGDVRTIPLAGGDGVRVGTIAWSPDSRWLAWLGEELDGWSTRAAFGPRLVGGRVPPATTTSEALPELDGAEPGASDASVSSTTAVTVSDAGDVLVVQPTGAALLWDGTAARRLGGEVLDTDAGAAMSPDGRQGLVGTATPGPAATFVTTATGEVTRRQLARDTDRYPDGAVVRPLGWTADDLVLALVTPVDPGALGQVRHDTPELVLMTAPSRPTSEWTYRVIGTLTGDAITPSLSVAADLVPDLDGTSSQQLTRDFAPPGWTVSPWRERLPYVLGALMALLGGLALIRMLRHQA